MSEKTCKKSCLEIWIVSENPLPLHSISEMRAFSSAGSEHLPYKQRVGGSNPSTPTREEQESTVPLFLYVYVLDCAADD